MKPKILVLYYSQSGQLRTILETMLQDVTGDVSLTWAQIEPLTAFPFPWKASTFFDAMPESVQRIASPVKPLPEAVMQGEYNLVILGYQPWFLHPSQPVTSFMKSEYAQIMKGKPVVTVVACRNMWLNAEECIKEDLLALDAKLVGNIVLVDTKPNLVSLLTIIRWAFKGQKEASGLLPAAGVQEEDVQQSRRFGPVIADAVKQQQTGSLHQKLLDKGAVTLKPGLVLLERNGIDKFRFFAKYISEKGGPGDPARAPRVKQYQRLLMLGIFVLSPITSISAFIKRQVQQKNLRKDVAYFKTVAFEKGMI